MQGLEECVQSLEEVLREAGPQPTPQQTFKKDACTIKGSTYPEEKATKRFRCYSDVCNYQYVGVTPLVYIQHLRPTQRIKTEDAPDKTMYLPVRLHELKYLTFIYHRRMDCCESNFQMHWQCCKKVMSNPCIHWQIHSYRS